MTYFDYDLFVIGGGSGGIRAARLAAETGAKVALAEQSRMGGTCVIRGCVPKKLMVNAADFSDSFVDSLGFGWSAKEVRFNWKKFREAKDKGISQLESMYRSNLHKSGVKIFDTRAVLTDAHSVRLARDEVKTAKHILIATGGSPFLPNLPGIEYALCSDDMFLLNELPKKILVVGGGYIACEFATIMNGLGCEVSQYYRGEMILRGFDSDVREHVLNAMCNRGIQVHMNTDPQTINRVDGGLKVGDNNGNERQFETVLYATGRRPNTEGLGLEEIGVASGKYGEVIVDGYSQSSVPSIFAVGDVTNRLNLTPVAIREGAAFVETIFKSNPTQADHENVPTAVFTRPEIGTVGMTQEDAENRGEVEVYKTKFRPLSSAIAERDEKTLMKMVLDRKSQKILGIHIVGPAASEIIQMAGIAIKMGAKKIDFDRTVAVHPTLSEEIVTMKTPENLS